MSDDLTEFRWSPQPEAAELVRELLDQFLRCCPKVVKVSDQLLSETGTRLIDWIDHVAITSTPLLRSRISQVGFEFHEADGFWRHVDGLFPQIRLGLDIQPRLGIKVDSISDFAFANQISADDVLVSLHLPMRSVTIDHYGGRELCVVERHGCQGWDSPPAELWLPESIEHTECFRLRKRRTKRPSEGFEYADDCIGSTIKVVGVCRAADLFFTAEREYWMSRNSAAQVQYARQQKLGLGWANHDHHTYRSSREYFVDLIAIMEQLGLQCRERFYAGEEAGWGAQVMEQPNAGIVVFADVDLSRDEVAMDFAHERLPPRKELGTVGLWCKLHGESILEAGMHHLECRFHFDEARRQLAECGIKTMKPFTDLPYLKQAFTEGEMWPVDPHRIDALLADGSITDQQAETFRREGAIGSHMEILERNDGYKGFNQSGINEIIRDTDPRKARGSSLEE